MNEQIVIGIRGPKGEKLEFIDADSTAISLVVNALLMSGATSFLGIALETTDTRYKKIPK